MSEFTTTLVKTNPETADPPQFTYPPPDIMSINIGGKFSGTLLDNISREDSYKHILTATATTDPIQFTNYCNDLQQRLRNYYGLNIFDEALAMIQVLYNSAYWQTEKLYKSGCFHNPNYATDALLSTMGLKFAPTS